MRILSIIAGSKTYSLVGIFILCVLARGNAEKCSEGRGLTSNYINYLVGNGDTLLMVTGNEQSLYLNMINGNEALSNPTKESNWWSFSMACYSTYMYEIVQGGGFTVASFDSIPNIIWYFNHTSGRAKEKKFSWPEADSTRKFYVSDAIWTAGTFFFACLDGGVVQWDPDEDRQTVFLPGSRNGINLPELDINALAEQDSTQRITGIELLEADSLLLVVTPARIWRFSLSDTSWDTLGRACANQTIHFKEFLTVYVNTQDSSKPLYATVLTENDDGDEEFRFCKYLRSSSLWYVMFDEAPKALSFGPKGYIYTLYNEERSGTQLSNIIRTYRDTLSDSGIAVNPPKVEAEDIIHTRMRKRWDIDIPPIINDILYVSRTDSTGYLWIASSEGLFFSPNEHPGAPGNDTTSFLLIKRAPKIESGLKKTYARPGILGPSVKSCKFIYNISDDYADVTIKVYDYNNDPVKTIIENETRSSGSNAGPLGRSTVESRDSWDGTNVHGRPVAPGVYYYKITTSTGERAFGKIVVAR